MRHGYSPVLLDFPRPGDDARHVTSIDMLRSNLRTKRALARQSGNQARGGRAGGEGVRLASSSTCRKTARSLIMAGPPLASALRGVPRKNHDKHTTHNRDTF